MFRLSDLPNRTLCDVIQEMRDIVNVMEGCNVTQSKLVLKTLVEETQSIGNRMEAALADIADLPGLYEKRAELKKDIKDLKKELGKLIIDKALSEGD